MLFYQEIDSKIKNFDGFKLLKKKQNTKYQYNILNVKNFLLKKK